MNALRILPLLLALAGSASAQSLGPVDRATARDAATQARWTGVDGCPFPDLFATAEEAFYRRYEALLAGDLHTLGCMYAKNATVIMPGTVVKGREAIVEAFSNFGALFGGAQPELTSVTWDGITVLATFSVQGPVMSVLDGADTFVIVGGQVVYQTVHASLVPSAPAP